VRRVALVPEVVNSPAPAVTFGLRRAPGIAREALPRRGARSYSRAQLLDAIRRWVERYGEPPTSADWEPSRARRAGQTWRAERFETATWPTMRMLRTEFGSLNAAIRAAGFEPRTAPTRIRSQIRDPAEILRAIREWTALYGAPPAMSDWDPSRARRQGHHWRIERYRAGDWPSARTVCSRFGSFRDATVAAGLEPRPQGRHAPQAPEYSTPRLEADEPGPAAETLKEVLALRVRAVAEARRSGDEWSLRAALVDVAAGALAWAEALGGDHPASVMETLAIRRHASAGASADGGALRPSASSSRAR
jgi:hypothetical protein